MILLTLGTGIGSGIVLDGRVWGRDQRASPVTIRTYVDML